MVSQRSLPGTALPGRSWLSPELALTLCRFLALAELVSFQHVLAAGTPVGEQRGLWLSHPRQCIKKGDKERVGGRQAERQ